MNPDELPSQEKMLSLLANTEKKLTAWITTLGDEGSLKPQDDYAWTGKTPLGRVPYVLMHVQNHIGEINAELRRRRLQGGAW